MDKTDVLVTPSVWNETFGYTVIEALSYGVPVIVSNHVGAKDVIPSGGGIIVHDGMELRSVISDLTPEQLKRMNQAILDHLQIQTMYDFFRELLNDLC